MPSHVYPTWRTHNTHIGRQTKEKEGKSHIPVRNHTHTHTHTRTMIRTHTYTHTNTPEFFTTSCKECFHPLLLYKFMIYVVASLPQHVRSCTHTHSLTHTHTHTHTHTYTLTHTHAPTNYEVNLRYTHTQQ